MPISDNGERNSLFSPHMHGNGANILVAGDDPRVEAAIKLIVEKLGDYGVLVARSGPECLRQAKEGQPALVLLNIHMPDGDGLHVLRQLRAQPETSETPVLMVSVDAQFERMAACFEAGANDFLIKPLDPASLYHQVRTAIAQHGVGLLQRDALK